MKIEWRLVAVVLGCSALAALLVTLARQADRSQRLWPTETLSVVAAGKATELLLQIRPDGVSLGLPDCNPHAHVDRFMLHVFPRPGSANQQREYVNMDFDLRQEKGAPRLVAGRNLCVFEKRFDAGQAAEVQVGQFTLPEGKCCEIKWSRRARFDLSLQRP